MAPNAPKILTTLLITLFAASTWPAEAKPGPKIFGGQEAAPGQFPYMISFRSTFSPHRNLCGGSILSETWILTAGHCVEMYHNGVPDDLKIAAGTVDLMEDVTLYGISQIVLNPTFDLDVLENDLALIRLQEPLEFSEKIQKIEIGAAEPDDNCTVSGWGFSELGYADRLLYLETKAITVEECLEDWESAPADYDDCYRGEKQICTYTESGEGNCYGDSGGPLASNGKLVGVVSTGVPCAAGFPDIYTRTATYSDWISAITGITYDV